MKSLSLNQPHVVVMVGLLGSGKTFFAEKFASTFNSPYVDMAAIEKMAEDEELAKKFIDLHLSELFKTKQIILLEGPSSTKAERAEIEKRASDAGYQTLFIWVQTTPASSKMRAEKSGYDEDEIEDDAKRFEAPDEREKFVVISGKHTFGAQLKAILKRLSTPRPKTPLRSSRPTRNPNVRRII